MLEKITGPADIKNLKQEDLPKLAEEIREKITEIVFKNGGHLGSNLGVVELTIALYYVFNFLEDSVVWDVSHQCYTHKILSGRKDKFNTLRLSGGISGFTSKDESPFDSFTVGHAGTSVSTAVGLACANKFLGNSNKTIAVLGDGALTAGMTFEALNHAGTVKPDMLIILNDNKMSISKTIGAMSNYLNKLRMGSLYEDVKKDVYWVLDHLPSSVGHPMSKALNHLRSAAVATIGGFIFEELGLKYYGPIDGHNIPKLILTLKEIIKYKGPLLLHIITEKGKGSDTALADPCRLHGVSAPIIFTAESKGSPGKYSEEGPEGIILPGENNHQAALETKEPLGSAVNIPASLPELRRKYPGSGELFAAGPMRIGAENYTDIFAKTVVELGNVHKNLVVITAAMPEGTGLIAFEKVYPNRYFDVGICEQHALGLAAGLAKKGLKPLVAIYSTFLQRGFDQLFQEIALQSSPVIFALDRAGLVGSDGPTHHGVFDIAYTRIFPQFILMAPKDGTELKEMLKFVVNVNQPVFIRYPRTIIPNSLFPQVRPEGGLTVLHGGSAEGNIVPVQLGKSEILKEGNQGALFAYGTLVYPAYEAALKLAEEGINLSVVNARFAKPLDEELIAQLITKQPFVITLEEHTLTGGFGSAVLEFANQSNKNISKIIRLGIPDKFIEHGNRNNLLNSLRLDTDGIIKTVRSIIKK
jgi:1-deoxy-D-xylulose-5-phosphate synthase